MRRRRPLRPNIADMMKAFGCIDAMLARLADGWIHEIQGAAVFKNPQDGVWYEIPAAMEGWVALWERLDTRYDLLLDLGPARKIIARLRYGTPIPPRAGGAVPGGGGSVQARVSADGCVRDQGRGEDATDCECGRGRGTDGWGKPMKTRPILFSAPMVRAILSGTKTQTRRAVKPRKDLGFGCMLAPHELAGEINSGDYCNCPYGQPGDRLWVKETTIKVEDHGYTGPCYVESDEGRAVLEYGLSPSPDDFAEVEPQDIRKRPAIHMPRTMCRILLEITAVRVERLQDISDADATAEGVCELPLQAAEPGRWWTGDVAAGAALHGRTPFGAYRLLWESINNPRSWDANPWVWVIEFTRVEDSKS